MIALEVPERACSKTKSNIIMRIRQSGRKMALEQSEIYELHTMMINWFAERDKDPADIMAFLSATYLGQLCLNGYDEDFIDKTLLRTKEKWINHPLRKGKIKNQT